MPDDDNDDDELSTLAVIVIKGYMVKHIYFACKIWPCSLQSVIRLICLENLELDVKFPQESCININIVLNIFVICYLWKLLLQN